MTAFDNSEFENYKQEVKEKWGKTEAYKEYSEKTKDYSKDKQNILAEEMNDIFREFSLCMKNGNNPDSSEAQFLVKRLQAHITENYYHCTDAILSSLGQMYVCDERFRNNIDKNGYGTAMFVSEAIIVCCCK